MYGGIDFCTNDFTNTFYETTTAARSRPLFDLFGLFDLFDLTRLPEPNLLNPVVGFWVLNPEILPLPTRF